MNIGFVSTWLERGATYVTKTYMQLLEKDHDLFVYARGGEKCEKGNPNLDTDNITWGLRLGSTKLDWGHFSKWIKDNKLDVILFNEQKEIVSVLKTKKHFPNVKIGAYIDYYTEKTVSDFEIYDFLLCNTKRHYSVFNWHSGAYYVPWGTDINLFNCSQNPRKRDEVVFFHSAGMSSRKGTQYLVNAFINGEIYKMNAKLVIHSQISIDHIISKENAKMYNIELIVEEVPAPGLYHMGDVYVYPTTLDGLGLTIYEALACSMPVITTDCAPMNEIVNDEVGKLVTVDSVRSRKDGYYWPLSIVNENSLAIAMKHYCMNINELSVLRNKARSYAVNHLNILDRKDIVKKIFEEAPIIERNTISIDNLIKDKQKYQRNLDARMFTESVLPNSIKHLVRSKLEEKRFGS